MSVSSESMSGGRRYRLISADGHFNEPGSLWVDRVPAAMKDRAPRMERFDEGDAWGRLDAKFRVNWPEFRTEQLREGDSNWCATGRATIGEC